MGLALAAGLAGEWKATAQYVPPAPEQPLPFSHQQHLAMGPDCATCHAMPEPGDRATLPPTATCMACHFQVGATSPAMQQLAESDRKGEAIPWKRVYQLPDFVYFSHKQHVTSAELDCQVCHGAVREMAQMQKVKEISMASCLDCHRERRAPVGCEDCHEPL